MSSKYETFFALKREYKANRMLKAPEWYAYQFKKAKQNDLQKPRS